MFYIKRYSDFIVTFNNGNLDDCKDYVKDIIKNEPYCNNLGISSYSLQRGISVRYEETEPGKYIFRLICKESPRDYYKEYLFTVYDDSRFYKDDRFTNYLLKPIGSTEIIGCTNQIEKATEYVKNVMMPARIAYLQKDNEIMETSNIEVEIKKINSINYKISMKYKNKKGKLETKDLCKLVAIKKL